MGVTQAQIAKLAGVSRGTVDRVINRRGHVDPAVEAKIRQHCRRTGLRTQPGRQHDGARPTHLAAGRDRPVSRNPLYPAGIGRAAQSANRNCAK